ncbi:hypothetical protein YB2330_002431 [Saitoella coloradoensis]
MKWIEEGATQARKQQAEAAGLTLAEYERLGLRKTRSFLGLNWPEVKLLSVAGTGFFLDAYDLFIINLVQPIFQYEYWQGTSYPAGLRGLVSAGANIGNIFGQLSFGFLGDMFGRKYVYGKELIICMIGTILVISLPNSIPGGGKKMIWIFVFRVIMGIGIGGDYPMSAAVTSERANLKRRGQMLAWIFSFQGWGNLAGSIVTIIVLACFEPALQDRGEYNQLDAVWRIQFGVALVPSFLTIYQRLTMPESKKFTENQCLSSSETSSIDYQKLPVPEKMNAGVAANVDGDLQQDGSLPREAGTGQAIGGTVDLAPPPTSRAKWNVFFTYFSEWRHAKILIGTTVTWFLLDIAFYGVNLNQSVILAEIGFNTGNNEWQKLMRNAIGNLIISAAGYVPGYWFTIAFIEILGRRWIQVQGFLLCALFFAILAGTWNSLSTGGHVALFALAQFFFNFGANATTFIIPAEVFPSRVKGFAHGLSAACGKVGAVFAALVFNYLQGKIGIPKILWIFFACMVLGAAFTFLIPETKERDADLVDYEEVMEARRVKGGYNGSPTEYGQPGYT